MLWRKLRVAPSLWPFSCPPENALATRNFLHLFWQFLIQALFSIHMFSSFKKYYLSSRIVLSDCLAKILKVPSLCHHNFAHWKPLYAYGSTKRLKYMTHWKKTILWNIPKSTQIFIHLPLLLYSNILVRTYRVVGTTG